MLVLEVKGKRGPVDVNDARQLTDWVNLLRFPDDESEPELWKGLLVGNSFRHLPPDQRIEEPFTTNCVRVANQENHALMTTSALIAALRLKQSGEFDSEGFWIEIVQTVGVMTETE